MADIVAFVDEWNKNHKKDVIFIIHGTDGDCLSGISIRYVAAKYRKACNHENWERFKLIIETKSHETIFPVTGENFFERGIINLLVACQNHTYKTSNIISTLEWIGKDFFPSLLEK